MALIHNVFVLILLSLAASGLSVSLQTQIDQLYQIYQATQNNIIQLNTEISLFNEQLANLRDMVKALKIGVSSDVVILLSDVGTLKNNEKETKANLSQLAETVSTQLSSVRYAMDVTNNNTWTKIKTVQSSVDTLNTDRNTTTFQLSSLQSSVDTLNTRVNSPVNLYQDCIQETKSCRKPAALTPIYHTSCATDYLPMNVTGYYTLDMRCQYDRRTGHFDTAVLRSSGDGRYQCNCISTGLSANNGNHYSFLYHTFTCTLVVTRCPQNRIY